MHHVAIMKKSWKLIPKILSGEKTIESRWYQTRRSPWNTIAAGDTVFFKNAGEAVTVQATVSRVLQYTLKNTADAVAIVQKYGKRICIINVDPKTWDTKPKYCVLVFLERPKQISPFTIEKAGFGISSAWLTIPHINRIKIK
jgi:hypothetical protein